LSRAINDPGYFNWITWTFIIEIEFEKLTWKLSIKFERDECWT